MTNLLSELSQSLREPQEEPADHCYTIIQDHGPNNGGWGPSAIVVPWLGDSPRPFVYTGSSERVIEVMSALCRTLAEETGKPTILARYTQREDVFVVGGSS
jgi:hypothetical protein